MMLNASYFPDKNSLHTFPFEGNWNLFFIPSAVCDYARYTLSRLKGIETWWRFKGCDSVASRYTLSRLKGIETLLVVSPSRRRRIPRYTLSRLKGIETQGSCSAFSCFPSSRYTLSRLKGIETVISARDPTAMSVQNSLHTFPFEGNWNASAMPFPGFPTFLATHFPVWRELKRKYTCTSSKRVWVSLHTFPFEGNGNAL